MRPDAVFEILSPAACHVAAGGWSVEATEAARGAWDEGHAHGGAPAALLTRAVESLALGREQRVAALGFAFLGPVPLGRLEVATRIEKEGRRQSVVTASLRAGGRVALTLRAMLLRRARIELPPASRPSLAGPEAAVGRESLHTPPQVTAFHPDAVELRLLEPAQGPLPGEAEAWLRLRLPLVAGEPPSPAQRAAAAADFGSGLTRPLPRDRYVYMNCDLSLSLAREPRGEWIGLRAKTLVDGSGAGVTSSELHDLEGPCGSALQTLFVDRV
jgi:hypothetical protein